MPAPPRDVNRVLSFVTTRRAKRHPRRVTRSRLTFDGHSRSTGKWCCCSRGSRWKRSRPWWICPAQPSAQTFTLPS
jgi:hypothetical protein